MKRILTIVLSIFLITNACYISVNAGDFEENLYLEYDNNIYRYNNRLVTIEINENEVQTGAMPAIILSVDGAGRTLVPAREVFESENIGAKVDWDGSKQEVYITYADQFITLKIDDTTALVNGKEYELDVPAKLIRDMNQDYAKTMIPLRFVSEALNYEVSWDGDTFTASLVGESFKKTTNPMIPPSDDDQKDEQQDTSNSNIDPIDDDGQVLDGMSGSQATKTLPTALATNPVEWIATEEQIEEINSQYVENEIVNEDHEETTITDIDYDGSGVYKKFIIGADSAISSIDYFVWNEKFIIDISNAVCDLPAETTYEDNPVLTGIRASQYSVEPNATRVVFDLFDAGSKFQLSYNEDRTELTVMIMDNSIHNIQLSQNEFGDCIKVTGVASPDAKMFRLSHPDRIVIDFPNTKTIIGSKEASAEGQYVSKIRTAQFDSTTTRIVVETDGQADYDIIKATGGETIIQLREPTYKNIAYENKQMPIIILEKDEVAISTENITTENSYLDRMHSIILPDTYKGLFGEGSMKVNDGIIDRVEINEMADGRTRIDIQSKTIYEFMLVDTENRVEIRAYKPTQLFDKVIVIDAGHGGKDPGASANGLVEKELNLNITLKLKTMLDYDGSIKVYYTRLDDTYPTLQDRCDVANEVEADFFLSVHNNAFGPSHKGTETLYFPWNDPNALSSPDLAAIFHKNIVEMTGNYDRGLKDRKNLYVLKHTKMPAIIIEGAFLTNDGDAAKLKEEKYLSTIAEALYRSIKETFETYPTGR